ncbi:hypothetical protein B296_00043568 [Ensete ventricosum]|uniref:Uncharacterized protein n=1 Tax=Ensete ventricosum TaxID=4639 RepID=A0A426XI39_ENSVE|nr:hypothetical protein B296_00043568 [Ensete ventricosum]
MLGPLQGQLPRPAYKGRRSPNTKPQGQRQPAASPQGAVLAHGQAAAVAPTASLQRGGTHKGAAYGHGGRPPARCCPRAVTNDV